jgi:hypothetical protein
VNVGRGLALVAVCACSPAWTRDPDNAIDARARLGATPPTTATVIYAWAGSRSLAVRSRCRMLPTDSEAFAVRATSCGGLSAWYWGVSRLLLEEAATPAFLHPLPLDGRMRWIDLPGRCGS